MGVTAHGFWYPDPTTRASLQGMFSAAATASEQALVLNNVVNGVPVAASTAALTSLYTAQGTAPTFGSLGSVGGVIYWWTGAIWQNINAVYSTFISATGALATVTATWKAHSYSNTVLYPTGGYLPGVGGGSPSGIGITTSGRYRVYAYSAFTANATGRRGCGVGTVAGGVPVGLPAVISAGSPGNVTVTYTDEMDFVAGDVVCGYAYQDSGVNTVTVGSRGVKVERVPGV